MRIKALADMAEKDGLSRRWPEVGFDKMLWK